MASEKLPEAPKQYDKADQDRTRRLIERGLSQPPSAGTIQVTQVTKEVIEVVRQIKAKTHAGIGVGATVTGTIDLSVPSAVLIFLTVDKASWVRFYASQADADADATRLRDVDPLAGKGVLGEFIVTPEFVGVAFRVAPVMYLYNGSAPVTTTIVYAVTNDSGVTTSVTMTLTIVDVETAP
jgi:hypothetical protein